MSSQSNGMSCAAGCWALAAGVGLLTFVLLLVLGDYSWPAAIFLGGLAFVLLGFLFSWLFCAPLPERGAVASQASKAGEGASAAPAAAAPAAAAPAAASAPKAEPKPEPAFAAAPAEAKAEASPDRDGDGVAEGANEGSRPEALDGPRDGGADDLKKIKGIGPKLEKLCNSLGFYHFDQIAGWTADEVAWVDSNLEGFKGRVTRDDWVEQAKLLASGGETAFSKKVDKGDVY